MPPRNRPPFDKNDKKYRISSCCCLHIKRVVRIVALIYIPFVLFDTVKTIVDNKYEFAPQTYFRIMAHCGAQITVFCGVVGQSKSALIILMFAMGGFTLFVLIYSLIYFQDHLKTYMEWLTADQKYDVTYSQVAFANGAAIILAVLALLYTIWILHKYTCYIADRDRARVIPIVYYDAREETVNQNGPVPSMPNEEEDSALM